ncbi:Phytochrome-like protein cph1 [Nocardioides dokdonensis FR1436]|uniref:Sensor-like histidine kinase SenX3 n=1 Tax=Nocardioides dokdonensis FR1436 TaxID=1300347 RepID=A0A1A9GG30_9ACTN|nr:ATP-binding protein [Nocardioides dokdonensis]ANH37247.1 Phytochrome-like protein cph1 [Nocardioides dokdonensis FR1436]
MSGVAVGVDEPVPARAPGRWRTAGLIHLGGAAAYVVAFLLGRLTTLEGTTLALTWPAAGVVVLWLLLAEARRVRGGVVLLPVVTGLVNLAAGGEIAVAVAFAASNGALGLTVVLAARRLPPSFLDVRSPTPVTTGLGLIGAGLLATAVGVAVGHLGLRLAGVDLGAAATLAWWGRNFSAVVALVALAFLFLRRRAGVEHLVESASRREHLLLFVTSLAVYATVFAVMSLPLTFLPMMLTLWAGLRCTPGVAALHSIAAGTFVVGLTLLGRGPFAGVGTPQESAVVVQLYVAALVVKVLLLVALRSEREAATQQLEQEQEHAARQAGLLQAAIGSVNEGLVVVSARGEVVTANTAAARMLAWPDGAAPPLVEDFPALGADGSLLPWGETPVARGLRGESVRGEQLITVGADGRRRWLSIDVEPLSGPVGQQDSQVVVVLRDVTGERERFEELESFAGTLAHDLRGPLAAVGNWSELAQRMARGDMGDEAMLERALDRLGAGVRQLDEMIDTMLHHALTKEREAHPETVDLTALVLDVVVARGLEDSVVCDRLPPVAGDVVLLRQLVDNLVGNAVKFVAPGVRPRVRVSAVPHGDRVEIHVVDNGIGVAPELRGRVFDRFERGVGEEFPGTGLGLWLCRTIVERHDGAIEIGDGPHGRGACVRFDLPSAAERSPLQPALP